MHSIVQQGSRVLFPAFTGERVYMRKFTKAGGLPDDLKRWQGTVDQMLDGVDAPGNVYLMVDQGRVIGGMTHRRPGLHIDGYWCDGEEISAYGFPNGHGFGEGGNPHRGHGTGHGWTPPAPAPAPKKKKPNGPKQERLFSEKQKKDEGDWNRHILTPSNEILILASDIYGCDAFQGEYNVPPGTGGDYSHLDETAFERIEMEPGIAWRGKSVEFLHKPMILPHDCLRTVVRLNVQQ